MLKYPSIRKALAWALALLILGTILTVSREHLRELRPYWAALAPGWIALVFAHTLLYRVINASGWVWIVRTLHWKMPLRDGLSLWLVSESCRWLPGSVWSMFSRVHLASRRGLSVSAASVSVSVELLLTLIAWALTALIGLLASGAYGVLTPYLGQLGWVPVALLTGAVLAGVGFVALRQFLRSESRYGNKVRALFGQLRLAQAQHPRYGMLALVVLFYVGLCLYNGYIFWLILHSLSLDASLSQAILANSLGWILGFLAVAVPGGIGVREAVIVGLLSGENTLEAVAMAAVLWRLIQVFSELACLIPWGCQKLAGLIKGSV